MLVARRTAPAPEVEHYLDSAQQIGEIDNCSAMTLRLYGNDDIIRPVVTNTNSTYKQRRQHCLSLAGLADDILPNLPPRRHAGLVCSGLCGIVQEVVQIAETFSNWAIDDEVEGGDLLPFRHGRQRSRNGVTFKNTIRRLNSPKFIRRYVKRNADEHTGHLRELAGVMIRRAKTIDNIWPDRSIMEDWRAQMNFRQRIDERAELRDQKGQRKMILRSLRTAISVVGQETVSAFLRGEEVKLIGTDSILVVRKRGTLSQKGHGCLSVGMADRNGTRLADLCTYVEKTPTLDQLSAFALWMQSGEELQVFNTANIIDVSEAGRGHPLLVKSPEHLERHGETALAHLIAMVGPEQANKIAGIMSEKHRPFIRQITHEQQRARNDAYWEKTKGHWIEAMIVLVIGYRNLPIFKATGAPPS